MNDVLACCIVSGVAMIGLMMAQRNWTTAERPWIWGGLILHLCAAVAQVQIVRGFYGFGDMISYYRTGVMVAELWRDSPADTTEQLLKLLLYRTDVYLPVPMLLHGPSGAMVAISSILMLVVHDSLYAGCMAVAVLAFTSKLAMYRVFQRELIGIPRRHLLIVIVWMPSVVFWSSGILKESLAIAGLGWSVSGGYGLARPGHRFAGALVLAGGVTLALLVKAYVMIPFGIAAGVWVYFGGPRPAECARHPAARSTALLLGIAIAAGTILGIGHAFPRFGAGTLAEEAGRMQGLVEVTSGGSDYDIGSANDTTVAGQLANLPYAVATALFRPLPFEVRNTTMAVSSIETSALTLLLLMALWRTRVLGLVSLVLRSPLVAFCTVYAVGFAAGVGISTTNLGTLSRYRAPMVPFYGVLLVAAFHRTRLAAAERGGADRSKTELSEARVPTFSRK